MDIKVLKQEIKNALSPKTINTFFRRVFKKNVRMIDVMSIELDEYTLDDLFTKDIRRLKCSINNENGGYLKDVIILFVPVSSEYIGHFQVICKKNRNIYFFDSYGNTYTKLIKKVNTSEETSVKINNNFGQLVINSKRKIISNEFQYQTNSINDSSCGYHTTIVASYFLTNKKPDFNSYNKYILNLINKYKLDTSNIKYDAAVLTIFNKVVPEAVRT